MLRRPISVTEFAGYQRRADELLAPDEQDAIVDLIAFDPTCGDLIPGTGGLRKVRVGLGTKGKRGGARVIYYFYNEDFPVLLMAIYAKNEKADLSDRDKKKSVQYAKEFLEQWRRK
jgi:mRNA-degrading endonuclease RelE of RelBE toxin-antitoxin system